MEELLIRIEDLKLEVRHKGKKIMVLGEKLQLIEELKAVQKETHRVEGKKESLEESEKGNVMEGKESVMEEKKKSLVVGIKVSLVDRKKEIW